MSNKMTEIDVADDRSARRASKRKIKIPGKSIVYANTDPVTIARELRAKSALGRREKALGYS